MKTATLTIVFTDIKGFTERTSRSTREENERLLATHSSLLTPIFRAFGGRIVKEIGDAFLVTFESPTMAVLAGTAVQDRLWQHNRALPEGERLEVRVAMNIGEVRLQGGDVFGEPVNIAARVEGIAEAGEVWLTEGVYLAMNKAEVPAEEVGQFELKGIPGKVRLYKVPRAPYRVEAATAAEGGAAAADAAPYANLGLSKMPDDAATRALAATAELTQRAVHATTRAVTKGESLVKGAVGPITDHLRGRRPRHTVIGAVAVALLAIAALVLIVRDSPARRAIGEVASASAETRRGKAAAARRLIEQEEDRGARQVLLGELEEALGEPDAAARHYVKAHRDGERSAARRILKLLDHEKCPWRVAGLSAVRQLELGSARSRVRALAKDGGPGDGEKVLFFGCNSKATANEVLGALP